MPAVDPAVVEAYLDDLLVSTSAAQEADVEPDERVFIVARAGAELMKRNAILRANTKDPGVADAVKKATRWFTALARGNAIER